MSDVTVISARKIITMDRNRRQATHVAMRDGKVLAVGGSDVADPWGGGALDDRLADAVLMPGFVEGHSHLMAGAMWRYVYCGFHDRVDPDGTHWPGLTTIEAVIDGLKKAEACLGEGEALVGWGFDPIFMTTERLNRRHLDAVTEKRPVLVMHSNFHLMTVNSAALALGQYDRSTNVEGVAKFEDGEPNGELQEMAAMFPLLRRVGVDFRSLAGTETAIRAFGQTAMRCGTTTAADLFNELPDEAVATLTAITGEADYPLRIVPALSGISAPPAETAARIAELRTRSTDKLRLGAVKLMADGSIQGYTARVKWPGYVTGHPNGIWNMPPAQMAEAIEILHQAGIQLHIHVNGDEASEMVIDALEDTLRRHPRGDHRHVLQHCQMADEAQFRRMGALGIGANLFSNHIWYFGDQHHNLTIGPDKAHRIDAGRSALDNGVPLAIHSDAPVTPMGPLFTAWCAANRVTPSGRVLGESQRLTLDEALYAITLGNAHSLRLDGEIGSIETGKKADFAILGSDPHEAGAEGLKDVPVLGSVSCGMVHLA